MGNPTWSGGSPTAIEHEAESFYDEDGWMACAHCGAYEDGDEEGEDTETEDEADPSTEEYQAYLGDMTGAIYEGLRHDYLWSKARFRHFTGRLSRRARFPRRALPGQRGAGGKGGARRDQERAASSRWDT